MSLLLSSLAHHGRRRLRPQTLALHTPSPLISKLDDENNDNGQDPVSNQRQRMHYSYISMNAVGGGPTVAHYHTKNMAMVTSKRQYHATPKREILPFIAVGLVAGSAVYTYRALQQMDQDWEDYYDAVEEYKARTGIDPEKQEQQTGTDSTSGDASSSSAADDMSNFFKGGTLGIDMGTTRLKLSHRLSLANKSFYKNGKPPSPVVSVDREGFRSTPALAWVPPPSSSEGSEEILIGRLAQARSYDTKGGKILIPREVLERKVETAEEESAIQQTIRAVAINALDQVLGSKSGSAASSSSSNNPVFVLDDMSTPEGSYNVRPIFTIPVVMSSPEKGGDLEHFVQHYQQSVNGLTSPAGIADFVPEPVAIVCGAEYYNLLPSKNASTAGTVLVVDVGGTSTCVSMVGEHDKVLYSTSLPFGGDTFIDLLVSHLVKNFYGAKENEDSALSTKVDLNDPTALQRLYEASTTAIHELSNKTRSDINIPYLTMDLESRQPKHMEVGMARSVVDAELETWVRTKLVPHLQSTAESSEAAAMVLSQALPSPTNLSTLFSSAIMAALEQTSHTPHMLRAILLVGGGARIPLVRDAMKEGVGHLAGDTYVSGEKRLIMPEGEMGDELSVLGAAVWGSGGGR